jgi:hypothetical protein
MMKLSLLILTVVLASCGVNESAEANRDETVFDPMVDTMDQVRGVEQLSADRKRELDQGIEASE